MTGQILVTRTVFRVWGLGLWGLGLSSVLTFDFLVEESLQDVLLPNVLQNTSDISGLMGLWSATWPCVSVCWLWLSNGIARSFCLTVIKSRITGVAGAGLVIFLDLAGP